jgi:hypothetical protein
VTPAETAERICRAIARGSWFSAVGEDLTDAEIADARHYLTAMGRPGTAIAGLASWPAAKAVAVDPGWDTTWWDAEERMRDALTRRAVAEFSQDTVHDALNRIAMAATEALQGEAAVAASRSGDGDIALIKSAAGAATQACHQMALARIAAAADHPFEVKFRLYEGGRWPLAIVRDTYYIL